MTTRATATWEKEATSAWATTPAGGNCVYRTPFVWSLSLYKGKQTIGSYNVALNGIMSYNSMKGAQIENEIPFEKNKIKINK